MVITTKQGKGGKITVFADDEAVLVCEQSFWYSLGIYEEDEIDGERLEEIRTENERRRCCAAAYNYLSARAYSERAVRQKLAAKFDPDAVDYAVERSKELGLIDDGDLAGILAEQLLFARHYAPSRITAELQKRGIARDVAEAAVAALEFDAEDEIKTLLETKFRTTVAGKNGLQRTAAALSRMGYSYGEIRSALEACSSEEVFFDE